MRTTDDLGGKGGHLDRGPAYRRDDDKATDEELTKERITSSVKGRGAREKSRTMRQSTNGVRWSDQEDATLLSFAGEKSARELAKLLGRTQRAVYCRLWRLRLSSQLKDGYTPKLLADDLRVDRAKVRQWLLDGKLESQSLHVTRRSIKNLCEKGEVEIIRRGKLIAILGRPPEKVLESLQRCERKPGRNRRTSGKARGITHSYTFRRASRILQVSEDAVKQLVATGLLKLSRLRIEEDALRKFMEKCPGEINWPLVDPELLKWFGLSRIDDENLPSKIPGALRHLMKVRTCPGCHHSFRGNAYWTHLKFCPEVRDLEPEVLQWAAEHPRSTIPSSPPRAIIAP